MAVIDTEDPLLWAGADAADLMQQPPMQPPMPGAMYGNPYVGSMYGNPITSSPYQLPQQHARGGAARGMDWERTIVQGGMHHASGGRVDKKKLHHLAHALDWSEFTPHEIHSMLTGHAMNQIQQHGLADDDEDDAPNDSKVHYERIPLRGAGYRLPNDAVHHLGGGDYQAAFAILDRMFGTGDQPDPAKIPARILKQIGDGDELKGHRVLDAFVKYIRGNAVKLKNGKTVRRHDVA